MALAAEPPPGRSRARESRRTVINQRRREISLLDPAVIGAMRSLQRHHTSPCVAHPVVPEWRAREGAQRMWVKTLWRRRPRPLLLAARESPTCAVCEASRLRQHALLGHVGAFYGYRADVLARWDWLPPRAW